MKKIFKFLTSIFNTITGDENITVYSAYASFYMVISFVPFLILTLMIVGRFMTLSADDFAIFAGNNLPKSVVSFISHMITEILENKSVSLISVPIVALIWSASRSVVAVTRGLDKVYDSNIDRSFIKVNLYSLFYTAVFLIAVLFSLVIMVFGNVIADVLGQFFPFANNLINTILSTRAIVSISFLTLLFACIYTFLPSCKQKFTKQLPGALFAASGWMIFSLLFSIYFDNFSNRYYLYGSLTALVLFMLWIYFCMVIIFIGGKINHLLLKEKSD